MQRNKKLIDLNIADLEEVLMKENPSLMSALNKFTTADLPALTFCAIDNDLLPKADLIKQIILKDSCIPIIGESVLGTWLATNHYKGKKEFILRDCLPLIQMCSEFIIVVDYPSKDINQLFNNIADGVLYELAYWFRTNTRASILNIFDYTNPLRFDFDASVINNIEREEFKKEIYSILDKHIDNQHKTVFSITADNHGKHADWLRMDAFINKLVPVCPHTMVSTGAFILAHGDDLARRILNHTAIALKSDQICIYGPFNGNEVTHNDIPLNALFEVYLLSRLSPELTFHYKSFFEANIPKFSNDKVWAITTKELEETREEQCSSGNIFLNMPTIQNKCTYFQPKDVIASHVTVTNSENKDMNSNISIHYKSTI